MTTGADLKAIRVALGLRLIDVAGAHGVSDSAIGMIEAAGRLRPTTADKYLTTFARLAEKTRAERDRQRVAELLASASA